MTTSIHHRTCPLCEATCGLSIEVNNGEVGRIRGDLEDVFSKGFLCPKGSSLKGLQDDPDRLRRPLIRHNGEFVETDWDTAWAKIDEQLPGIITDHGKDAVGLYTGNPWSHNFGSIFYLPLLYRALGKNRFAAASTDQRPREIVSSILYGARTAFPIPDLDRTEFLLLIGSDPLESNGSMASTPDWPGKLRGIQERGGSFVVVDPRRSKTAELADEHLSIVPGTDAAFLAGIANACFADGLVKPGHAGEYVDGLEEVGKALARFTPELVAPICGISAERIRSLAHELSSKKAAVHGRLGTCLQEFGTLSSWLVDVVSLCTGNLDVEGGAMFSEAAAMGFNTTGQSRFGPPSDYATFASRVAGLPGVFGQLPAAAMIEEMETPGEGQIRALITIAGNPVLSTADSNRLDKALASLEFMVSVDPYLNETTRHADVILPPPTALERSHYDISYYQFSMRNISNYSPAVLPVEDGMAQEWEMMLRLASICDGKGPDVDIAAVDDGFASLLALMAVRAEHGRIKGREHSQIMDELGDWSGPERLLDLALRVGPYGDAFGDQPDGLSLNRLVDNPHGIDLGALRPRLPDMLRTPTGRIDLAYPAFVADLDRLGEALLEDRPPLVLIGRRHLRSNNSWQHNVRTLMKGRARCLLQVHPDDAAPLGLVTGGNARVASPTGSIVAEVEVTNVLMPGVVSLPHGWGHGVDGTRMSVAAKSPGVNANILGSNSHVDPLSGNPRLNGIPVSLEAVEPDSAAPDSVAIESVAIESVRD